MGTTTKRKRATKKRAAHGKRKRAATRKPGSPSSIRFAVERVRLNRQGYDSRGRYYGVGEKLYRVTVLDATSHVRADDVVRAATQREAKAAMAARLVELVSRSMPQSAEDARESAELLAFGRQQAAPRRRRGVARLISTQLSGVMGDAADGGEYECINFEGCSDSELRDYARDQSLHPKQRELARVFGKSRAARLQGNIAQALSLEAQAQRLYERLPPDLQW